MSHSSQASRGTRRPAGTHPDCKVHKMTTQCFVAAFLNSLRQPLCCLPVTGRPESHTLLGIHNLGVPCFCDWNGSAE
ncbi:hypothetical protein IMZ48_22140 [Candidatus Bathyarchaeota archaeon]|nr:hypothetical protein [Candidatus Bathyarchaeota archaeon]